MTAFYAFSDINNLRIYSQIISFSRLVLSAVSDYFAAMFTNDVVESNQEEVKMEGVDPDALNSLVQYAYTGMYWICVKS